MVIHELFKLNSGNNCLGNYRNTGRGYDEEVQRTQLGKLVFGLH